MPAQPTEKKSFYVTTAIAYVNAAPHIGFALELIYADVIARYQRLLGRNVVFLTGTDEHGQKIAHKAEESGKDPKIFTDETSQLFRDLASKLSISNTDFIRTTEDRHHAAVERFWQLVVDRGYIYKKAYRGLYCVGCEQFKTEKDLVDGLCPDHHTAPKELEEENYFFKLTAFREKLLALYSDRPDFVIPDTKFNEMRQLVAEGLEDVSISRSKEHLSWGIPVPGEASQVVYVWFDALVNYLTAAGFGSDDAKLASTWPADVHVVGKEINRFHSVLWPAMLMAAGVEVPKQIAVHGWIFADGQKMSKSLGNVIHPNDLRDRYGTDAMRYLLFSQVPFSGDGDYSMVRFDERYGSCLANDLGNLVYRVVSMLIKYRGGRVPERSTGDTSTAWSEYQTFMESFKFDQALEVAMRLVRDANQTVDREKPWVLAKEGKDSDLDRVLYSLLETIRQVAWMIRPAMPEASDRMLNQLGQTGDRAHATFEQVSAWGGLEPNTQVELGEPLFRRIEG